MLIIVVGHFFAMSVIRYQILEFYIQHSSLDFIQTAISAGVFEHIFLL